MLRSAGPNAMSAADALALVSNLYANQAASPTTGQTVVLTDNRLDGACAITPAGTLAALTITLPTEANSVVNQERDIWISTAITSLTINGATTIIGSPGASIANAWISVKKVAANTWLVRVS